MTVGIPSGRRFLVPGLGMYTRLTGIALNASAGSCTLLASSALAFGVSAISPSTPAVRRPALRSVTLRTLISVFARERSINFCNRRTLGRSPACDAVKIRCRNRRTSASARRQSTWRQRSASSSGPLTTTLVVAPSLSSGSGISVIFLFTGSPDRVSALSSPGTRPGIRCSYVKAGALFARFWLRRLGSVGSIGRRGSGGCRWSRWGLRGRQSGGERVV